MVTAKLFRWYNDFEFRWSKKKTERSLRRTFLKVEWKLRKMFNFHRIESLGPLFFVNPIIYWISYIILLFTGYVIIIIIIINCSDRIELPDFLSLCVLPGPQNGIQWPQRNDVFKSFLVSQFWCVHEFEFIRKHEFVLIIPDLEIFLSGRGFACRSSCQYNSGYL